MKSKIFAKLKQEYPSFGLGDEVLMARAESLAATGLVTDDNVDVVVAAQKRDFAEMQKLNDKRVTDALEKERKKHAEEIAAREKADKEAAEAKAKAEEEARVKLEAEVKAKAELDVKEKAAAAAAQKAKEEADAKAKADAERESLLKSGLIPTDLVTLMNKEREMSEARDKSYANKLADYEAKMRKLVEDTETHNKQYADKMAAMQKSYDDLMTSTMALKGNYEALQKENEEAKILKAKAERKNFIDAKVKELNIPQWRVDEGFVFASDADEVAISETLQRVANNIKTQQLPYASRQMAFPITNGEPTADDVQAMANKLVK